MAGRGSRFADVGYKLPKPLIDVRGRPMYTWALDSLPLNLADCLIFVCLQEHLEEFDLKSDIDKRYAEYNPQVIALNKVTEGQACTVLEAAEFIDNEKPLLIYNADTYCHSDLAELLAADPTVDGVLGVFEAPGDKWSFAKVDANERVVETAEKVRISDWACNGMYYFRKGTEYVRHTNAMVQQDDRTNGEFYVAPLYNRMIASGDSVRIDKSDFVWGLGTPEDLDYFLKNYPESN